MRSMLTPVRGALEEGPVRQSSGPGSACAQTRVAWFFLELSLKESLAPVRWGTSFP